MYQLSLIQLTKQVFRWSALGVGVVYGIVHRYTLTRQAEHKRKQEEYAFKDQLIREAKAAYLRQKNSENENSIFSIPFSLRCALG